ncbi:hypothetical protein [Nocardiopsis sp. Huas11]|uniref:hypothetical protein n=1 Tax=Nocardiopsis sp. Huas11 TaxID=2183912 RepID=UPI000EB5474F|nr:hypothetical protein [Nocardiopsis sp. Huas11]
MEGEFPRHYDHEVRLGVRVPQAQGAAFLALVRGQPWRFLEVAATPEHRDYDVHLPVSGAAVGSAVAAATRFRKACDRSGVDARITTSARLRSRPNSTHAYLVLPDAPTRRIPAALFLALTWWRAKGRVHAQSLTEARARVPEFVARNPEAGPAEALTVVGLPDRIHTSDRNPVLGAVALGVFLLVCGAMLFYAWRAGDVVIGPLITTMIAVPCLFGLWQVLIRIPESLANTWFPLIITVLAIPAMVALGDFSLTVYLDAFGIGADEVALSGISRFAATTESAPRVLQALVVSLGLFGLIRHFHLVTIGGAPFLIGVLAVLFGLAYVLGALTDQLREDAAQGEAHVETYRAEGGESRFHSGVEPAVVCVDPGEDPVTRVGPPLTTDRPVLYFAGANDVDLLWDREEGVTRVPRFSVALTPVDTLDDPCPATD